MHNADFSNLPKIEILSPTDMNGAQGAYSNSNNTIYLSSSPIESQSITAIQDVIVEEIGHFIDAQINTIDTQGDEEQIWRNLVLNQPMTNPELKILKNENDWNTLSVNSETLHVKNSTITQLTNNNVEDYHPLIDATFVKPFLICYLVASENIFPARFFLFPYNQKTQSLILITAT